MSQSHHISYDPEIKGIISKEEHVKLHGHGTGRAKGSKTVPRLSMGRTVTINPNTPHALYFPKILVADGFKGELKLVDTPYVVAIFHPKANLVEISESLVIILREVNLRRGLKTEVETELIEGKE